MPLVPTAAVWSPDPARLDEVAAFAAREGAPPAACLPPGDPAEGALREAAYRPVAGVALDPDVEAREDAPGGGPVAWDRAAEAAAAIAGDVLAPDDPDRAALAEALAALLAAAIADDEAMRIELGGDADARAAALVYEDARAALVVLTGGPAERIARDALAAARGLGRVARRVRETGPDATGLALRRWERRS